MATREENIKKINDELEKLDDEQLEQVAGGLGHRRIHLDIYEDNANTNPAANQLGWLD